MSDERMNSLLSIALNVVGGIATIWITWIYAWICRRLKRRALKAIFGEDVFRPGGFSLVYAVFALDPILDKQGKLVSHPFKKPAIPSVGVSIAEPVSGCELRATKYLAEKLGQASGTNVSITSDTDAAAKLDLSFISLGGLTNLKTRDALENDANRLVKMEFECIASLKSNKTFSPSDPAFDYGLILKVFPVQFPKRTWLVCAGIGEWGTSGAAYYLAHKFRHIFNVASGKAFAVIVKVRKGQDESATPVEWLGVPPWKIP
jgi:hypothetical protein